LGQVDRWSEKKKPQRRQTKKCFGAVDALFGGKLVTVVENGKAKTVYYTALTPLAKSTTPI
jgi:hypothetical protein